MTNQRELNSVLEELVLANHILAAQGICDAMGHVSLRSPYDKNRYLMSCAMPPALVTIDEIVEHDLNGHGTDAEHRQLYQERFIHGEVYRRRPNVGAVVHSHSPSVTSFSVSGVPLRAATLSGAFIGDGLPVFDSRTASDVNNMLVADLRSARALAEALGRGPAVLMRGHGSITVGSCLRQAVGRAVYLELNARMLAQAIALGGSVTYLSEEEAQRVEERRTYDRPWRLWTRSVTRATTPFHDRDASCVVGQIRRRGRQ